MAYGYGACVATIGDDNKVSELHVAYDVGRVVNPQSCEGQVEVELSWYGYGVTEDFKYNEGKVVTNMAH